MKTTKLVLTILTIVSMMILGPPSGVFADDTIKIGEIQTYSKLTNFTFPYRNGWQLALEEINNSGGVMGKKLEVISRDDAGKPGTAVTVAEELKPVSNDFTVIFYCNYNIFSVLLQV